MTLGRHRRPEGLSRATANDNIVTLAMIETRTALANIDAIAATPGIDGLFLGPSDLSIALSDGRRSTRSRRWSSRARSHRRGGTARPARSPGAYCAQRASARLRRAPSAGCASCAVASDMAFLRAGARTQLDKLK